ILQNFPDVSPCVLQGSLCYRLPGYSYYFPRLHFRFPRPRRRVRILVRPGRFRRNQQGGGGVSGLHPRPYPCSDLWGQALPGLPCLPQIRLFDHPVVLCADPFPCFRQCPHRRGCLLPVYPALLCPLSDHRGDSRETPVSLPGPCRVLENASSYWLSLLAVFRLDKMMLDRRGAIEKGRLLVKVNGPSIMFFPCAGITRFKFGECVLRFENDSRQKQTTPKN